MATGRTLLLPAWLALMCGLSTAYFRGKEFITVFPQNDQESVQAGLSLLFSAYYDATKVTVTVNKSNFKREVTVGKDQTVSLPVPRDMELIGSRTFDKTLLIQANKEISVVAVSSKQHSTGATTVLPVEKLGTEYYVVTPVDTNNDKVKEFAVVAGKQGAAVDITVKGDVYYQGATHPSGSTVHVNLAPYESLQLQSTKSLSGTKVTSNEAVAVLSGHSCVQVNSYCDYAIEQLLPVSGWGNEYIVPPVPMQTESDLVYVVAPRRTTITYRLGSSQASENVVAGDVQEFKLQHNTPFYVTAPAGIQVIYFFTGIRKDVSGQDPFLINIPPVSSYCTSYSISSLDDFESHILLVAQHSDTSAIKFNKKLIGNIPWRMIPGLDYSWAMYSMSKSTEADIIEHSRSPFGVLVFGFQNYEGYGFAGLCATPTSPPSCADLECKEHETCTVVKGNPTCVKDTESICWATGDPHYRTFDGKNFDFMGTCTYTLSKTCTSDASLPVFSVEAKNENRGNTQVSYVGSVTVRVYDIVITVVRGETGIVRVNNQRSRLPISLANGKLKAYQNGDSVLIKTDFLLKVFFDWDHHLVVKIPSKLSNKVCGLCGNSNGDPRDDATTPDGLLASDPVELGRSWKVDDGDRFCWDDCNGECKTCSPKQIIKYKADTSCGLLTKKSGPFQRCHATIDPKVYLDNCVYDLCMNDGLQSVLCQVLKTYADKCREAEIAISDWRTPSQCPMSCPENSVYTACGPACPATCNDLVTSTECQSLACVETCACREGFVLDAGKCIPKAECGCAYEGRLFAPGEEFWADDACTRHCVCDATSRQAKCRDAGCRIGEQCRVEKGILDCYPVSYGTCSAAGRTHYQTFDGSRFVFQGSCLYQLAGLCKKSQGLVDFQVLVQNGHQDNQHLSAIAFVQVKVYGGDIAISQKHPGKIMVDNLLVNLPYRTRGGKVSVYQGGRQAVVETDFGLTVTYDWQSQVTVSVPGSYAGALCGLCGNFDGNTGNELLLKDGQATSNPTTFGHSWKVKDIPGCVELPQDECPALAEALQYQDTLRKGCRIISSPDGPFRACHKKVDPKPYFQSCVSDFCFFQDQPDVTCPLIASYAAACQAAGVATARWRTADFCSISCPANSHYESCSRGCGQTCSSLYAPAQCSERCWEGCVCDEGFVLSGDRCVPMSQCGCLHQGLYYQLEETFLPTCWQQCQCQAGGAVQCQNSSCVVESDCKIVDGVRKCEASGTALCVVTGDRQYISYDGLAFEVPGACSYVLTKTCGDDGDLTPFVVTVEKEPEKTTKGSIIKALTIRVYGLTLTLLHGKMETVMVDNITYNLPAILRDGQVSVLRHGADVLLLTDFGLTLRYDLQHAATVAAPATYRGRLCGLCGNRDGQRANDWLLPDGRPATTAAVFGAAWQEQPAQPCADACGDGGCPSCPAEREAVLRRDDHCGLLVAAGGPLAACHAALDPAPFFHTCLRDGCLATADGALLCRSVRSYAAACADVGVTVRPWREPAFCPPSCPANSTYSLCADLCTGGCASLGARCPEGCAEGCRCAEGLLFDGRRCVPAERCGCFQDGRYYQPGEETLTESCHRRCTCVAGQGLRCDAHACTDDETCEIRNGAWSCVKQDLCKELRCRPKETCVLLAGHLRCVPTSVAQCWAWGDPHFRTFDGKEFDFHGTCTYTLASSCDPDPSLTPFSVEARNEAGGGAGRSASYVSRVVLRVYGLHVVVRRGEVGKIRVNGVLAKLPARLADGKLRTAQSGRVALLRTAFGLELRYDWRQHLVLELPSTYYKATCGLCGNFDQRPGDDGPPAGADNATVAAWAATWHVQRDDDDDDDDAEDPLCWHHCEGECPACGEAERQLYAGARYCGLLRRVLQGPFGRCHGAVSPGTFFHACLHDVCLARGARPVLCRALEAYAATCQRHGVALRDWRAAAGCALSCPENSHYEACASACPATCAEPQGPANCSEPCAEACACDAGHVLSGGRCVAAASCGCSHEGRTYGPGEEFWADAGCRRRCRCEAALGMAVCGPASCGPGERCGTVRGVRQCVAGRPAVCEATGDPHYTTFDGRKFDFMGTCVYQLAGLCGGGAAAGLTPFRVTAQNNNRGSRLVSFTKEVTLHVYNMTFTFSQEHPQKLLVDGVLVELPFQHGELVTAYASGPHGFVRTAFELAVTFDWHSYARVLLPASYAGAVCGLCGDGDGDPADDFVTPDGRTAPDATALGASWTVAEVAGCGPGDANATDSCTEAERGAYGGDKHCGVLVRPGGPLAACRPLLDPAPYFADCLYDACQYGGHRESVCRAVAAYVAECQRRGAALRPWRSASFCAPTCPPNQHYELCGSGCPATCAELTSASPPASCQAPCTEGCFCDGGHVRSGDACVPPARCGCHHAGRYYRPGATFVACPRCSERCTCRPGGTVECRPAGCGDGERCEVRDGVRGCYGARCGLCEVAGAGNYRTFDGRRFRFLGSCAYALARVAPEDGDDDAGVVPFAVEVEKEGGGPGAALRRVLLAMRGYVVVVSKGRPWEVTVNGERQLLPLALAEGSLRATQEGANVVLQAPGGLKLLYDGAGYAVLALPAAYGRRVRGLCGDFDGDAGNDLPGDDAERFAAAWKIPGASSDCSDGCGADCPRCSDAALAPLRAPRSCGMIGAGDGPFGACRGIVPPDAYLDGCLRDVCAQGEGARCRALQGYAAACQAAGAALGEWREAAGCPMECPANSHYALCTRSCDLTCAGLTALPRCTQRCFEGCECDAGTFFNGAECVPPENCGCLHRGRYFEVAETVLSEDCTETCVCRGSGGMSCKRGSGCPFGQACLLRDGVRACAEQPGRCTLAPGNRFASFDGAAGPGVPLGVYELVTLCDRAHAAWFRVVAVVGENLERDRPAVVALHLFTREPFVTVRRSKVWVNGVPAKIPATVSEALTITEAQSGDVVIEKTPDFVIRLSPHGEVTVAVPKELGGRLCGACGNYNGRDADDFQLPDGRWVDGVTELLRAWEAPDLSQ